MKNVLLGIGMVGVLGSGFCMGLGVGILIGKKGGRR
jgi:hypothetical protein